MENKFERVSELKIYRYVSENINTITVCNYIDGSSDDTKCNMDAIQKKIIRGIIMGGLQGFNYQFFSVTHDGRNNVLEDAIKNARELAHHIADSLEFIAHSMMDSGSEYHINSYDSIYIPFFDAIKELYGINLW